MNRIKNPMVLVPASACLLLSIMWLGAQAQRSNTAHNGPGNVSHADGEVIDLLPQESIGTVVKYYMVCDYDRKTASLIRIETDNNLRVTKAVVEKVMDYTQPAARP